jgi:hypothetical protein
MPFYPSKMLRAREHAPIPCSSTIFYLELTFGVPRGVRSTSTRVHNQTIDASLFYIEPKWLNDVKYFMKGKLK